MGLSQLSLFGEDLPVVVKRKKVKFQGERGCNSCPLNKKKKVFGTIKGREILIIGMNPGGDEEREGLPFVGKAGKLLWARASKLNAFVRSQCDVDNCVRCRSTKVSDYGNIVNRNPTEQELYCCSIHTENQLRKAKPKLILLLGEIAQKQFLGSKYQSSNSIFYDYDFKAWIVCTFHPSYLARGVDRSAWNLFDRALKFVTHALQYPGPYSYVKSQMYDVINTSSECSNLFSALRSQNQTIFFDIENDVDDRGRQFLVSIAFSVQRGVSSMLLLRHPKNIIVEKEIAKCESLLAKFMQDSSVKKAGWWGIHDVNKIEELLGVKVRNYSTDGLITEYLSYPNRKDYRLETVAELRFPEFTGYKDVIYPEAGEDDFPHMSRVPVNKLMLRNCGDVDLTRRATLSTMKQHNKALVSMLIDAAFMLTEMGDHGLCFDFEHAKALDEVYGPLEKKILEDIQMISGKPDFDPTDDNLRWLFIKKLGLQLEKKTKAGKDGKKEGWKGYCVDHGVLESLYGEHQVVDLVMKLRFIRKLKSTYIEGFKRSAEKFHGMVKTRFKLWGTSTGRISSGGDDNRKGKGDHVNLQNVHGDLNAKNLLVSTTSWREIVYAWKKQRES